MRIAVGNVLTEALDRIYGYIIKAFHGTDGPAAQQILSVLKQHKCIWMPKHACFVHANQVFIKNMQDIPPIA